MGYWPFDRTGAALWAIYDNSLNWTTNTHMAYMAYVRLRGIQAPTKFTNEWLIKMPCWFMLSLWISGFLIFLPPELILGTVEYSTDINYQPLYLQSILALFIWFIPEILIAVFSVEVFFELRKRDKRNESKLTLKKNKKLRLSASVKFQILIFTYWIQWFIPCILEIIQPFNCISIQLSSIFYWLTYTVFK